jgi:hypothetical protein
LWYYAALLGQNSNYGVIFHFAQIANIFAAEFAGTIRLDIIE